MSGGTMNAERLLEVYEQISEAPDAIARLRQFVLDLAVRGKLVEQDAADEPTARLVEKIEKQKLAETRSQGVSNIPTSNRVDEQDLFAIPNTWKWVPAVFPAVGISDQGKKVKTKDVLPEGQFPVVDQGKVKIRGFCDDPGKVIQVTQPIVIFGDHTRETKFVDFDFVVGADGVKILRPVGIEPRYYHLALSWLPLDSRGYGRHFKLLKSSHVPLPPLAEQHRIVAKVDELMALCDRLEEAGKTREEVRDKLTAASLARLTAPETTAQAEPAKVGTGFASGPATSEDDFPTHAAFALEALPALTTRSDQIKTLRQTILNLAVRGKLVEQDPADEPANQLLARIDEQREEYLAADYPNPSEAKTQRKKQKQQVIPPDLPKLPGGWCWSTLQQSSLMVIDCKNKTAPYSSKGIRLIRTTNVRDGKMNSNDQRFVTEATYEAWSLRGKPQPGDILITREAPMGEVCIIPEGEQICLGQRMMLARLVPDTIAPRFMLYSLQDPDLMERVQDKPLGMTVQHLRVGGVETLLVPLPPLAEQYRIVAKVDALMAICDRLEAALTTADTTRTRLLEALLHEALDPDRDTLEAAE